MSGKVYLVGAGPGDPKLLTLKGLECIQLADVIVYDHLANPQLLDQARSEAERIYAGKASGDHTLAQDEINQLIIKKAKEGKVVVRLKGGDPFIFGRGGEEAEELAESDVEFEVVPGVTSAIAAPAYAGIPLTHRKLASSVAFVTGHEDANKPESSFNWEKLSTGVGTLVFLMGVGNLAGIAQKLQECGRSPDEPVAVIRWGTFPTQEVIVGTLKDVAQKVEQAKLKPPAIIVVGDVVKLREKISWFDKKPLFGKTILVTRSRTQASEFAHQLEGYGANVIQFPTIEIVPLEDYSELDTEIENIANNVANYDWIIFTSLNAIEHFKSRLNKLGKDFRALHKCKICAIGPRTAETLEAVGIIPDCAPEAGTEDPFSVIIANVGEVNGKKILIPRAKVAREALAEQLTQKGAIVKVIPAYQTVKASSKLDEIEKLLANGSINMITFTSSSTVTNFLEIFEGKDASKLLKLLKLLESTDVAAIGPITAQTARQNRIKVNIVASKYTIPDLVKAIAEFYSK